MIFMGKSMVSGEDFPFFVNPLTLKALFMVSSQLNAVAYPSVETLVAGLGNWHVLGGNWHKNVMDVLCIISNY